MILSPDLALLDSAAKDALIRTLIERLNDLTVRLEVLEAENAALRKENAELRVKLDLPPKTPDNSSTPPSQGHKASGVADAKPKAKPHAGAHRPLHPNPTRRRDVAASQCQHCRADVSGVVQTPVHSYDRIEIPEIKPDVTRVALLGGMCPCCAKPFKAAPPAGLEPGSPFGPNLRAFAIYLRFTQAISFERLSRLFSDLLGLEISEGALVNMLDDSKQAFARAANLIRARLLAGTILQSDETSVRVGKRTWWTWGIPPRRGRLLRHPSQPQQGRGRTVPGRAPPGLLGFRPARRPDELGQEGPSGLSRPSHPRCPICHRCRRHRIRAWLAQASQSRLQNRGAAPSTRRRHAASLCLQARRRTRCVTAHHASPWRRQ